MTEWDLSLWLQLVGAVAPFTIALAGWVWLRLNTGLRSSIGIANDIANAQGDISDIRRDIEDLREKHDAWDREVLTKLGAMQSDIAKINGQLSNLNRPNGYFQ